MAYRGTYLDFRQRCLAAYDTNEVESYDKWISSLTIDDHSACLADLQQYVQLQPGLSVLDAGSGTGALSIALAMLPGLQLTALEPCPAMLERFSSKPQLAGIKAVRGFCDHPSDQVLFPANHFDVIASRQLANTLFDPIAAFQNWFFWLRPNGTVVVMDGLFDRDAWTGCWEGIVDTLPLAACRTMATVPYLLEAAGFQIESVGFMDATNQLPSTRTKRYMVVARKPV